MRRHLAIVLSALAPLSLTTASFADEPTAAALAERAMAAERWIHDVESIQFRIESVWTNTEKEIVARRLREERFRRSIGIEGPVPDDLPHLQPRSTTTVDIALDTWRYKRAYHGSGYALQMWDGEAAYTVTGASADSIRGVGLANEPTEWGQNLFIDLSWLRTDNHRFWFSKPGVGTATQSDPLRFTLLGREVYRGVECYVLETDSGFRRWYVGISDGLVRGMMSRVLKQQADTFPLVKPIAEARSVRIADIEEWVTFLRGVDQADRRAVYDEYYAAVLPLTRVHSEHFLDEYEEVSPGWWFPRLQGYTLYNEDLEGEVFEAFTRTMRIADLRVNEPLDDSIFAFDVPEGVEVTDMRYDVLMTYRAKANRTEEEFQALLDESRRNRASRKADAASQAELTGQAAPPFPAGATWLNGEPVTWHDLRGKVVVVAFFANWCSPCRGMYPDLMELHEQRERFDIAVIGVHAPSTLEIVERYCERIGLPFPVMIDAPQGNSGEFWSTCRVNGIPHVMVVRPDGKIAGSGWYQEMLQFAKTIRPRE